MSPTAINGIDQSQLLKVSICPPLTNCKIPSITKAIIPKWNQYLNVLNSFGFK